MAKDIKDNKDKETPKAPPAEAVALSDSPPTPQWDPDAPRFLAAGRLLDTAIRLRRLQPEQVLALRAKFRDVGLEGRIVVTVKTRPTLVAALQAALVGPDSNRLLFAGETGRRALDGVSGETIRGLATQLCEFNSILE